jgi:hypothetical protein
MRQVYAQQDAKHKKKTKRSTNSLAEWRHTDTQHCVLKSLLSKRWKVGLWDYHPLCVCVCVCVYPFSVLNKSTNLHSTLYERVPLDDTPVL